MLHGPMLRMLMMKSYANTGNKHIRGGGIHRVKQHLVGIRGQVLPCEAPNEVIGEIRVDLLNQFKKIEEDKTRQKEIEA